MPNRSAAFELVLFDADDTLFDFTMCESTAFRACLSKFVGADAAAFAYPIYRTVSAPLWRQVEGRRLTLQRLNELRWELLAARCGFEYVVEDISVAYMDELSRQAHLIEGAIAVCSALAERHTLGIVTNGFDAVQRARLAASPLRDYFAFIVTSEAAGEAKPGPRPFEHALSLYGRPIERSQVLVVGDNLHSDIAGGRHMQFMTCWFNPAQRDGHKDVYPHHTIYSLYELLELMGGA